MQHARFSFPSAFRKCIYKFEARLSESYLLGRICLIAITNRYIVLAPLQSMLIFNSKGSRPRCLSCNRIKRKTDCSRASGYTFIIRFLSRYRERKTETLRGKRKKRDRKLSVRSILFLFVPWIYLTRKQISILLLFHTFIIHIKISYFPSSYLNV